MYTKQFPYKDLNDKPRNDTASFNLFEREVFKNAGMLQRIYNWLESMEGAPRDLTSDEVTDFYTDFEELLLVAWGVPSADGLHFRKGGRYEFEESALFNAIMVNMVSDPAEVAKMLEDIMPKGLDEIIKKADVNLEKLQNNPQTPEQLLAEIARLREENQARQDEAAKTTPPTS